MSTPKANRNNSGKTEDRTPSLIKEVVAELRRVSKMVADSRERIGSLGAKLKERASGAPLVIAPSESKSKPESFEAYAADVALAVLDDPLDHKAAGLIADYADDIEKMKRRLEQQQHEFGRWSPDGASRPDDRATTRVRVQVDHGKGASPAPSKALAAAQAEMLAAAKVVRSLRARLNGALEGLLEAAKNAPQLFPQIVDERDPRPTNWSLESQLAGSLEYILSNSMSDGLPEELEEDSEVSKMIATMQDSYADEFNIIERRRRADAEKKGAAA